MHMMKQAIFWVSTSGRHHVMLGVVGEWPLDPDFCRVIFAHSGPPKYSTRHSTLQLPSR